MGKHRSTPATTTRPKIRWIVALGALTLLLLFSELSSAPLPADRWKPQESTSSVRREAPAIGAAATNSNELRATLADMGRSSVAWNVSYMSDDEQLYTDLLDASAALGVRHHVITVEFWSLKGQKGVLRKIAEGAVDGYLRNIASQMQAWHAEHPESELIVRPLHEANYRSYPWGFAPGNSNDNREEDFAPAWARIWRVMHTVFPELKFFLCPNGGDASSFYDWGVPTEQVDYVGHDLYNRSQQYGGWTAPAELHDDTIRAIRHVYPDKPYVIAETGTSDPGDGAEEGSKAEWLKELAQWMDGPASALGVVAVCYFDHDTTTEDGNDWRIYPVGKPGAEVSLRVSQAVFAHFP